MLNRRHAPPREIVVYVYVYPNPSQYPNHIYIERKVNRKVVGRGGKTRPEDKRREKYPKEREVEINCQSSSEQGEIMSSSK